MPRPFFHERGIACGTICDKVPMAKMITVNVLIIIIVIRINAKWRLSQLTLKGKVIPYNKLFLNSTHLLDINFCANNN